MRRPPPKTHLSILGDKSVPPPRTILLPLKTECLPPFFGRARAAGVLGSAVFWWVWVKLREGMSKQTITMVSLSPKKAAAISPHSSSVASAQKSPAVGG